MTTLEAHLAAGRGRDSVAVVVLVQAMAAAGVRIADELARAALIGWLGTTGDTNVQGEKVKKLDRWANDVIVEALDATGRACTLVSEEMGEIRHSRERCAGAGFLVCFDPVDGSSNLDVNGIVGTIFSVLKKRGDGPEHARAEGIYLYPEDAAGSGKQSSGKLRLMYECSPMGLIVEQAGGVASTGRARVLDLVPAAPHERVPLLIGSLEDVRLAEEFYAARRA